MGLHPADLTEVHLDNTADPEVPGKASNLKWAVQTFYNDHKLEVTLENVVLTVADADVLFHPRYFTSLTQDFRELRSTCSPQEAWSMWQAPQLPYLNFYEAPVCSRAWGYISSYYEFGGIAGLDMGFNHLCFSAYSLPLKLALKAQAWDGDIIAEDHHATIKCMLYALHTRACGTDVPTVKIRPIYLPVKSTAVVSPDGYMATFVERWHQAKRHAQGVAESSYVLLALADAASTLSFDAVGFVALMRICGMAFRAIVIHLLPVMQASALAILGFYMFSHHTQGMTQCPPAVTFDFGENMYLLCGFAGAYIIMWPIIVPTVFIVIANTAFVVCAFINPVKYGDGVWAREDGRVPAFCFGKMMTTLAVILIDCLFFVFPLMMPYGMIVEILAYWNVRFRGNHFTYVTAAKGPVGKPKHADFERSAETPAEPARHDAVPAGSDVLLR
eukprot:NODE_5766_length_1737_cov_4.998758.p1 GENE.NODE_5766_length_1737_cov_4.998758~~NODE_5766_length_1737_cov_4.998758.p1  ORF type:complete len:444 (+),score=114.44 NODE_5766_length_1737_cov_4.998758:3-1334(+)